MKIKALLFIALVLLPIPALLSSTYSDSIVLGAASFSDGFESGSFSAWSGVSTVSPVVQSSIVHHGAYAMRAAGSGRSCYFALSESTVYVRAYFYVYSASGSAEFMRFTAGANIVALVKRTSTGALQLGYRSGSSVLYLLSAVSLPLDSWHCVELRAVVGASGAYSVWLDGVEVSAFHITGVDNDNYGIVSRVYAGCIYSSGAADAYVDCAVISTSYIGPEAITTYYTLTVDYAGTGSGSVTKVPDQASYAAGEPVTLTAMPAAGSEFDYWTIDGVPDGSELTYVITMNSNHAVTAFFEPSDPGAFTIVVLPDTQLYSQSYPSILSDQTQWIVENVEEENILFVLHEGDIVNDDVSAQWVSADGSMSKLDGHVPWAVLPGNHDGVNVGSSGEDLSNYNTYFSFSRFSDETWYGDAYDGINTNSYSLFTGGEDYYIVFSFQYHPSDLVLDWATTILDALPDRRAIVVTHDYLNTDGTRTTEGNHIWNNFVSINADQIFLVLCGHNHGEARRQDTVDGHVVHQVLADYQTRANGGNGWLRILEFHPTDDTIHVKTFSPYLDTRETDADSQFALDFSADFDDVVFDSSFETGNLKNVEFQSGDASGNRFYTGEQDHTTASGMTDKHWWFYFSMQDVAGKTVTIKLVNNEVADMSTRWDEMEPVYSFDNTNWERLPPSGFSVDIPGCTFQMTISVPSEHDKVWLAPLPPYTVAMRDGLLAVSSPYLAVESLGTTPGGQELKVATITDRAYSDSNKIKAYVIAMQHSTEVPGGWEADGMMRFLLSDDPTAQAIKRSYIFRIVPIVNVDGVYYGRSRYTPLRDGVQYDLNRWWSYDVSKMPFEVAKIFTDIQAFQPSSFNDLHSTIGAEGPTPEDAVTYSWSTSDPAVAAFLDKIRDAGWPDTYRGTSPYACSQVHSRLGVVKSISWENPQDEFITNPGHKLTVDNWRDMGKAYAVGVYLDGGDAQATLTTSVVGSGSISKVPDQAAYSYGTSVQLTAVPDPGWSFAGWSGDLSGTTNPNSITITGGKSVTATFTEIQPYLFADGFESGSFSSWSGVSGTAPVVQSGIVHHGGFAMRAAASGRSCYFALSESTVHMRAYFYVDSASASVELMRFSAGANIVGLVKRLSDGALQLGYRSGGSVLYLRSGAVSFTLDGWHCVELRVVVGGSGSYGVWFDGVAVVAFSIAGVDNNNYGVVTRVYVGCVYTAGTADVYVDCAVVAETYIGLEESAASFAAVDSAGAAYRWKNTADQVYGSSYQSSYQYSQASVNVFYSTVGEKLVGTLVATNLKPNFAYQLKLVGTPDSADNEQIGFAGRWWQEEWDGTAWINGQNLNNKGTGYAPYPNDAAYLAGKSITDSSSPTGLHYRYTGYLLFDYFITDSNGDATLYFETGSCYHVLWKTTQRARVADDGPSKTVTFDPTVSTAYDVDYPESTVSIFGEWERLPMGSVNLASGSYNCQIVLTEESFHGTGPLEGNWAAAMTTNISFTITN